MTLVRFSVRGVICVATAAVLSACAQHGASHAGDFVRAPTDRASRSHSAQVQRSEEHQELRVADRYALHKRRLVLRSGVRGFRRYDRIPRRESFGEASAHQQHHGLQPSAAARNRERQSSICSSRYRAARRSETRFRPAAASPRRSSFLESRTRRTVKPRSSGLTRSTLDLAYATAKKSKYGGVSAASERS